MIRSDSQRHSLVTGALLAIGLAACSPAPAPDAAAPAPAPAPTAAPAPSASPAAPAPGSIEAELVEAVKAMQAQLPVQNNPGVTTEQVLAEGKDMVFVIRMEKMHKAELDADPEKLGEGKEIETSQLQMIACTDPQTRAMLEQGVTAKRRFVDAERLPLFEVAVAAADCPPPQA